MRMPTLAALLALASLASAADTDGWPQWRGPNRDAVVGGAAWPANLSAESLKTLWRVELGDSYSGPVVDANRVYVTETRGRKDEVIRALDRKTGKEVWTAEWPGAMSVPFFATANGSWIRSTPCLSGNDLFVAGIRDVVVCLDATTGKERWRLDFPEQYKTPVPAFGFVASPLATDDAVYVQAGQGFAKLDRKTGKVLWNVLKETEQYSSAFASPVLAKLAGKEQLVVQTRKVLAGVDPDDGTVLWSEKIASDRDQNIGTPVVHGDTVFTSATGGKSQLHKIEAAEGKFTVKEVWSNKLQTYMSSPVLVGDHLYLHLKNNRIACVALADGKECWTSSKSFGSYWSMVAQKDRILALDQKGTLYLVKANPEKFEIIDQRKVSDQETWAHLGIVGDEVFIREQKAMAVWTWK